MLKTGRLVSIWLLFLFCCTEIARAQGSGGKLIYCRKGTLYSAAITSEGRLQSDHGPRRIAHLPANSRLEGISVSADGNLFIVCLSFGDRNDCSLWTATNKTGAQIKLLGKGHDPSFAPFGKTLAFTANDKNEIPSVCLLDLSTGRKRVLRPNAFRPSWSADGGEILLCISNRDGTEQGAMMVDAATGSRIYFREEFINPMAALLSPDKRYVAYNPHLSRPKLAGEIKDRKTGKIFGLLEKGSPVLDWSADSSHLLWTRFILAPHNEGACLWYEIWETALSGKQSQRMIDAGTKLIDAGRNARYAPDGKHILYVRTAAHAQAESIGLYVTDIHHRKRLLAKCDDVFAVWKPIRRMEIANAPRSQAIRSLPQ